MLWPMLQTFACQQHHRQVQHQGTNSNSERNMVVPIVRVFRHAEYYEAVFTFHGILGEIPRRLYLRAEGSYDGKHEAMLSV